MSNRTERRAADRVARKISEAQLQANRTNAQLSTGPTTMEGKANASVNALKHGLTSKTVVLAGEDATEYDRQIAAAIDRNQPANPEELRLVQSVIDCNWRLNRITNIESAIWLKGAIDFADKFQDRTPAERELLVQADTYLKYEKSLRNLHTQEARLRRTQEKDRAELQRIQTIRKREEMIAEPVSNGFDFSTAEINVPQDGPTRSDTPIERLFDDHEDQAAAQ